jgi:hypothetical protein
MKSRQALVEDEDVGREQRRLELGELREDGHPPALPPAPDLVAKFAGLARMVQRGSPF